MTRRSATSTSTPTSAWKFNSRSQKNEGRPSEIHWKRRRVWNRHKIPLPEVLINTKVDEVDHQKEVKTYMQIRQQMKLKFTTLCKDAGIENNMELKFAKLMIKNWKMKMIKAEQKITTTVKNIVWLKESKWAHVLIMNKDYQQHYLVERLAKRTTKFHRADHFIKKWLFRCKFHTVPNFHKKK